MRPDVIDLREFYATPLGQTARRLISLRLRTLWPSLAGLRLLGVGFATPYLRVFRDEAERALAVMPAQQGVLRWPPDGPSLVTLAEEADLPFPDASIDRVLIVHGVESAEDIRALLREIWRVLTPSGRLLAVVPNRRGLWARFEHTPFGHGLPYTPPQLSRLMRDNLFSPTQSASALFLPPSERRPLLRAANFWESAGSRFWPRFAGAVLVEAEKQIYALPTAGERVRVRRRPALQPAMAGRASAVQLPPLRSR
jgi:SAM-dependent methyltransferase